MPDPVTTDGAGGAAPAGTASPGAGSTQQATGPDLGFMGRAVEMARKGEQAFGGSAIGCVLILDGEVVAEAHNEVGLQHDPTAHAEIVAIRRACTALGRDELHGATLYSTLQPCGMCTMASIWAGISRVVYGAGRNDVHPMYFEDKHLDTMNFIQDSYRNFEVVGGVMRDDVVSLYWGPNDSPPAAEQANT